MNDKGALELLLTSGFFTIFSVGMFGAFGAMAHYLYLIVRKDGKYDFVTMCIFFILGFFVGIMVNTLMQDFWGKSFDGLTLISGFLVIRILDFLDASGFSVILKRLGVKIEDT